MRASELRRLYAACPVPVREWDQRRLKQGRAQDQGIKGFKLAGLYYPKKTTDGDPFVALWKSLPNYAKAGLLFHEMGHAHCDGRGCPCIDAAMDDMAAETEAEVHAYVYSFREADRRGTPEVVAYTMGGILLMAHSHPDDPDPRIVAAKVAIAHPDWEPVAELHWDRVDGYLQRDGAFDGGRTRYEKILDDAKIFAQGREHFWPKEE
jgi:hypothetical protein